MINEIAEFIEDRTSMIVGTTLQVGFRPASAPVRCSLVAESGGGGTVPDLPDRADPTIQILSRAEKYHEARDDAFEIYNVIHGTSGWNLPVLISGVEYLAMTIDALALPQYIGQDEKGRFEFSTNYIFRIERATC